MARNKAETTVDQLLNIIKSANDDPRKLINLINAFEKTIPVVRGRKRMPKPDENLNSKFHIKRINYEIDAKVIEFNKNNNSYCIEVLNVTGDSKICPGVMLFISKRELELTGTPVR
jgi:hypothetical protein